MAGAAGDQDEARGGEEGPGPGARAHQGDHAPHRYPPRPKLHRIRLKLHCVRPSLHRTAPQTAPRTPQTARGLLNKESTRLIGTTQSDTDTRRHKRRRRGSEAAREAGGCRAPRDECRAPRDECRAMAGVLHDIPATEKSKAAGGKDSVKDKETGVSDPYASTLAQTKAQAKPRF
eukprot:1229355-Rhodomonas_salina.1